MAKVDYQDLAKKILVEVGGKDNIASAAHCITRLRLKIKDMDKVNKANVEALEGVITVVEAGGQFQVVIGDEVIECYDAFVAAAGLGGSAPVEDDDAPKGNLFNQFISLISSIFTPFLWTFAGLGLFKAFLSLAVNLKWLDPATSTTYGILNAASDSVFYFLPMFLAVTAAKRFKADQFTSIAIAGALVYPSIVAYSGADAPADITFMGIPVQMISYTSSVIPILFAVWIQSYLERTLRSFLPKSIRNFTIPLVVAFIMVPLTLIVVGPITSMAANAIADGVMAIFNFAPWLAGAVMGGFWQVFVMFGLHWGFVPIIINELFAPDGPGHSLIMGPLPAAVTAQAAAALAVMIRTKSKKRREVAAPGMFSGFFAGVTEPLIYGVNLPMKLPFYFGLVGGAIGGAIAAAGGSAADVYVVPSILALPAFMNVGNFTLQVAGVITAIVVAFLLTLFFGVNKKNDQPDEVPSVKGPSASASPAPAAAAAAPAKKALAVGTLVKVASPVKGQQVPISEVNDKVFASGALGAGVGVVPDEDTVVSPVSGTVATVFPTGHAYGIKTADGVEVLVHIGIDTVAMKGDGFAAQVKKGDSVSAGQPLAVVDFDKVKAAGYDTTVIVVVTNTKKLSRVTPAASGPVVAGDASIDIEI